MHVRELVPVIASTALLTFGCATRQEAPKEPASARKLISQAWGTAPSGEPVSLFTLTNAKGSEVKITNYGGVVVSVKVPDRTGKMDDVALGFDNLAGYLAPNPHFGATIGRYGNRIGKAQFTLNGVHYKLAANDGENHLHGGIRGFDKVVWKSETGAGPSLQLSYVSKDGEEGYPGNLSVTVTFSLSDDNEFKIDYSAITDKDTIINLTNHSYFNLAGQGEGDVLGHQVMINADKITPVDKGLIPTGELRNVEGTPFDFRQARAIGEHIDDKDQQIAFGTGYDMNYVLNRTGPGLFLAAKVVEPKSGRVMEVLTTEPGLQFYTSNHLDGTIHGTGGKLYPRRGAFCMETQHYPDSPNKPNFPSVVLKQGGHYDTTTVYKFSTM
jgi:aldose 1-epimerase